MKDTKRSILTSCISLLLCFVMLIGTTFAWFTDIATSANNVIQAGNLDVGLWWSRNNLTWSNAEAPGAEPIFNYDRWEPGYTEVRYIKVKNDGNLSFKYQMAITPVGAVGTLAEVIDVSYDIVTGNSAFVAPSADNKQGSLKKVSTLDKLIEGNDIVVGGVLLPKGETKEGYYSEEIVICVSLHMQETAGNEYQNLSIGKGFGITVYATQFDYENDSFDSSYDDKAEWPGIPSVGNSASADVTTDASGVVTTETIISGNGMSAVVPAGVQLTSGTNKLTLSVANKDKSDANVTIEENEELRALDVHIDGIAEGNTTPIAVTLTEALPKALNMGNYTLHHVEDGVTTAMTALADGADPVHNNFTYDPATGDVTLYLASFSEVALVAEPAQWEGGFDYEWYDADATELQIANADQLAAFGAIVGGMDGQTQDSFSGKIVKLLSDINLGDEESDNNQNIIFYPIGYYNSEGTYERTNTAITSGLRNFEGTFDGNGHTVSNFYQNTWEMKGDHDWYSPEEQYYRDGMGLFGRVYGGTVKNLTVNNFSSDGEIATTGVIAAYADFGATFENIAIFDCNPRVYNIGNGGIVGCVGWYAKEAGLKTTFRNITVDNSNKISALWGSYDVACGGIVGQYYPTSGQTSAGTPKNAGIEFENCHVSAVMDVYNDVCANYQYYAYRYTGMLIGSVRENETIDGHVYPKMDGITASGCTVHFGTWNDYYYCEIIDNTTASYTHDYQMSRLVQVKAVNGTTITPLEGESFTVPSSGRYNYVVVNGDHATGNATCYHFKDGKVWNHEDAGYHDGTDGGKIIDENGDGKPDLREDKQHIYLEFNNLVTGYGWGVTSKGVGDLAGVTILDRVEGNSVEKFEGKVTELANNKEYKLGDIFTFVDKGVVLVPGALAVSVTNLDENNPVSATIEYDRENWENGTITFTGAGKVKITIQDYYFCTPTTIEVTVTDRQPEVKFDVVMNNGDFLHRVGNSGTVPVDKLFKAKDGVTVGTISVTVEAVNGTGASGTYSNNAIQFSGTGVVKVTITDNDYCTPTELYLEVVDAVNATKATSATANNVVLLNDISGGFTVSGRYAVYGNGFTATYTDNGQYLNNGTKLGVINVSENGVLDNLRVKATIYPVAYLYYSEAQKGPSDGNNRYFYQLSAVAATGNATISNCYIYGGRTNIYIGDGNVTVKDSVLECGVLANSQIISSSDYTVTFENVTTIQHQVNATIGDTSKVMLGAGILVGDGDKDNNTATAPNIILNGDFKQYNWVTTDDKNAVSDSNAQMIINAAVTATAYNHTINGKTASNLGIIYLNDMTVNITNNTGLPYAEGTVSLSLAGVNVSRPVYSLKNATGEQIYSDNENADRTTVNGLYQPQFKFDSNLGGQYIEKTDEGDRFLYVENETLKVLFPSGDSKKIDLAALVNIVKYSGQNLDIAVTLKDGSGNSVTVTNGKAVISAEGTYTITYTVTDTLFYDKSGNAIVNSELYSWDITMDVALKEVGIPNAYYVFDSNAQKIFRSGNSNIVQFIPFLSGLKIYDYDENGNEYLRFDGGDTSSTTDYDKISNATIENINTTGEAQGYHIVTIEFTDGGKLVIDMDVRANSGSGTHSGSIKVRNNVIYVVNNGTTSGKGQTWKIYSYKFVGNNGTEINSGLVTFGTAGTDCDIATKPTDNFGSSSGGESGGDSGTCITGDTLITLADGSQVRVDSLKGDEMLLVWNMETGKLDYAPIMFIDSEPDAEYKVVKLQFSDGTEVKVIGEHGFWDYDLNKYVYLDRNAAEYIGHTFAKQNGDSLEKVQLTDVVIETEVTTAWSPVTVGHLCYFVNGMLSMPGGVGGLFNIFEVDPETMTYDFEQIEKDIETYGLFTYEELNAICPLTEEMFNAAGGAYLKISIGKGNLTMDELINMINRYSKYI